MLRVFSLGPAQAWIAPWAVATLVLAPTTFAQAAKKKPAAPAPAAPTATLDRIRSAGTVKLGYRIDARPFSYQGEAGKPAGFSVDLCQGLAESLKTELSLPGLRVDWVPVTVENRFNLVQQGQVDVLCGAETVTLERRKQVAFSLPIFPGGVGVLTRTDAPARLKDILSGKPQPFRPNYRGVALQVLREQTFAVVAGTTAEQWLSQRSGELQVESKLARVGSYTAGVQAVADREVSALFADRAILLDAAKRNPAADKLTVIDRLFTYEPIALAVPKGDDDFRLFVDKTLSKLYSATTFGTTYTKYFGEPDESALTFYRWNALPN